MNTFGSILQEIRRQHCKTLYDVASKMRVSSAFLSAIENSKKAIPLNFVERFCEAVPEARESAEKLESLANHAREQAIINLKNATSQDADLATSLARNFSNLSEEDKHLIGKIIIKRDKE